MKEYQGLGRLSALAILGYSFGRKSPMGLPILRMPDRSLSSDRSLLASRRRLPFARTCQRLQSRRQLFAMSQALADLLLPTTLAMADLDS